MKAILRLILSSLAAVLMSGCATSVTIPLNVQHSPLTNQLGRRDGTILVQTFDDTRDEDRHLIGKAREPFPPSIFNVDYTMVSERSINAEITAFYADALRSAGYTVLLAEPGSEYTVDAAGITAILEGTINEFWIALSGNTSMRIDIELRLMDKDGMQVLWTRTFNARQSKTIWFPSVPKLEDVVLQNLDEVLVEASSEFASEEFYEMVKAGSVRNGDTVTTDT